MRWDSKLVLTTAWTLVGALLCMVTPGAAPALIVLAAIAPLLWYSQGDLTRQLMAGSALTYILAVTIAYLLVNATWSPVPSSAYKSIATVVIGASVVHIVARTAPFLARAPVRAMALGSYIGFAAGGWFLCFEILSKHQFHRHLFTLWPAIAPEIGDVIWKPFDDLPAFYLNKHIAALTIMTWPAALFASYLSTSWLKRVLLLLACVAPAIVAVYASHHVTSKIALTGGAVVLSAFLLAPRTAKTLIAACWVFACVAVVPLGSLAYDRQLHKAHWLQPSAQQRIVIWGVTSSRIAQAPLLGHGISAARELSQRDEAHPVFAPGSPFPLSVSWHAHNAYLQLWFDAGLVGAVLLLVIGLAAQREISRLPREIQPIMYATFSTCALMAGSSFSVWANWLLASFMLCGAFSVLAVRFATDKDDLG